MASNSFKVKNSLVLTPKDLSTLVSPEAGDLACDINDNNKIKRYDANAAAWVEVGSGGVGGVDIFFVQDFESASLSSFDSQVGLSLSQTDPLKGKVSAVLTHDSSIDQSFKQVLPVDRKFRGVPMVLRLDSKSSASQGNLVIKIYDETNSADIVASEQLQLSNEVSGKKTSVGFTIPESCASLSYTITALPEAGSPVSRIDDIICEIAESEVIQSGLVQEADSLTRLQTFSAYGTTATKIPRFSVLDQALGSDITYANSSIDGASFTIQESGTYTINFSFSANTTHALAISKNPTALQKTTNASSLTGSAILDRASGIAANTSGKVSWTGYLVAGDIIYPHTDGVTSSGGNEVRAFFSIAKQNALKQVSVNPNSKITIPTSELRFEGASSRGSTATAIVRFNTQARLRGDAFSIVSDANNGTAITMLKAGKLDISSSLLLSGSNNVVVITRNQQTLTGIPDNSEVLSRNQAYTATAATTSSATTFVNVGDVIRVAANGNPTSSGSNNLNLSFQEQQVQVSVSNTLPQFSESDLVVRAGGNAGQTLTADVTNIPFITVSDTTGGAWNGSQFTVPETGTYSIAGAVTFTAASAGRLRLFVDGTLYRSIGGTEAADSLPTFNIEDQFSAGQVLSIRRSNGATLSHSTTQHYLNITKVGKPNVTGVDVTPFVNVPQPESQSSSYFFTGSIPAGSNVFGTATFSDAKGVTGIYSYNASTGLYTALKRAKFTISAGIAAAGSASVTVGISINNQSNVADTSPSGIGLWGNAIYSGIFNPGDTFSGKNIGANNGTNGFMTVLAEALSDQILTAPETFSTDTAPLQYAPSSTYTLSTLANAPVGTYITFTYAANTNTRTQTTTRPTQTDADMNANGMLIYTRVYSALSSAAQPAAFAIQVGKGLKGYQLNLYKNIGKSTSGSLDLTINGTAIRGLAFKEYNEVTGVLFIDAGPDLGPSDVSRSFYYSDLTNQASGYLVINASKNPALTGLGLNTVAARAVNSSGTVIPNATFTTLTYNAAKTFDTHNALNASTGVFTAPESRYYRITGAFLSASVAWGSSNQYAAGIIKNGALIASSYSSVEAAFTGYKGSTVTDTVFLAKGDTAAIQVYMSRTGGATALDGGSVYNYIAIARTSIGTGK